jgi:hypothetical protein
MPILYIVSFSQPYRGPDGRSVHRKPETRRIPVADGSTIENELATLFQTGYVNERDPDGRLRTVHYRTVLSYQRALPAHDPHLRAAFV